VRRYSWVQLLVDGQATEAPALVSDGDVLVLRVRALTAGAYTRPLLPST
jgi:hypothetical protein